MEGNFLGQAVVFLGAAILCVPIAKKIGMGSVLGYLAAGILIGPFAMGFVGEEGEDIMHAAEFGVVMMLFLVGLELQPSQVWRMRKSIVGLGGAQLVGTTVLLTLLAWLSGWDVRTGVAVSLALAMSSTAIVLQTLKEKGLGQTAAGQSSFSVLLFQDISVIPILAFLPLLAVAEQPTTAGDAHASGTILSELPRWLQTLAVVGAVGSIFLAGKYLVVPLLRVVAKTELRELFTATALLLVVGVAYLMQLVGLSPALGTFLAGVVLANSEYRHELESDLEPFKGLLLGLFFIGVGASINFGLMAEQPVQTAVWVVAIMAVKAGVLWGSGALFKLKTDQNLLFALALSQVGEFAFVLFAFSGQIGLLEDTLKDQLMAVTALTMTITPLLLLLNEKFLLPHVGTKEAPEQRDADHIDAKNKVIIAGFGHFGSTVGRLLRANGVEATILDFDSDQVDLLRKMGFNVYYGDATRLDLLHAAGAHEAKLMIVAMNNIEATETLIKTAQKHFPHLKILCRAQNRFHAYELLDLGIENVYRESLHTSVQLAVDALKQLGFRGYAATRSGQRFVQYDEEALRKLAALRHDKKLYVLNAREQIALQEELLRTDLEKQEAIEDHAWDSEPLRESANRR